MSGNTIKASNLWDKEKYAKEGFKYDINTKNTRIYMIKRYINKFHKPPNVLDIGCGFGRNLLAVADRIEAGIGIDPSDRAIKKAKDVCDFLDVENLEFVNGIGEDIPFPENSFDMIICFDVLEHVINPKALIDEIMRVLKQEGTAIFFTGCNAKFNYHYFKNLIVYKKEKNKLKNYLVKIEREYGIKNASVWIDDVEQLHLHRFDKKFFKTLAEKKRFRYECRFKGVFTPFYSVLILILGKKLFGGVKRSTPSMPVSVDSTSYSSNNKIFNKIIYILFKFHLNFQYLLAIIELETIGRFTGSGIFFILRKR